VCSLSLAALTSCEDTGVKPTTTVQAPDSADQVLEGFSHYVTNEGVLRSRVEADTAFFYEPTQITELHKVKVVFYDVKGAESSTLTARRGTYRWQDGSMEATGNVVVVSPDGRRLATEVLRYENATNLIVTDRPRGVSGDGMLLPGQ
jgi:LPS export ABC transporter protein LptC